MPPPPAPAQTAFQQQQQQVAYGVPSDLFGSSAPLPPFQAAGGPSGGGGGGTLPPPLDLFPVVDRSSAESLFGVPAAPTPPGRLSHKGSYESLFGNVDRAVPGNTTQLPQTREDQPLRSFAAPPPPAAPFLGYADPARSQSFRAPAQSTPSEPRTAATAPSPTQSRGNGQRSSPVPLITPPLQRIHVELKSPEDLVDEFLRTPLEARAVDASTAFAPVPPPTKLMLADIPDTVPSLEGLYKQKRWRTLTKKALSMLQNPSHSPRMTLEIKSWWLAGLIKDGHYDNATSVLDQIGDLDDPQYARSSDGSGDTFVLVRVRLLEALLSKCKGNLADHEKKLFQLIARIQGAVTTDATQQLLGVPRDTAARWLRIVQFTLVNHLLHQQKFALTLRVCSTIEVDSLPVHERVVGVSRLGRIHLQMGDLSSAEKFFSLARSLAESSASGAHLDARLLLNDGLLLFAQNKLQEALSAFDSVLEISRASVSAAARDSDSDDTPFLEEDLVCAAVNNYAICALYCCDVKGAVVALERMIRSDPARFLNAVVVFNLSSLYDLLYDNSTSTSRKEMMRRIADMYDLEHIDAAAFRI
ncbi:hypothetical protein PybrP1_010937 [[Pythium] brassicae (nom. inval.)]|nr:hypothetical protein PybrP1_010937 [[Pythium] brassicae (nom. inval.)]